MVVVVRLQGVSDDSKEFVLNPGVHNVGRNPAHKVVLDSPLVSHDHAVLEVGGDGKLWVEDQSLNGVRITKAIVDNFADVFPIQGKGKMYQVLEGDYCWFGNIGFRVFFSEEEYTAVDNAGTDAKEVPESVDITQPWLHDANEEPNNKRQRVSPTNSRWLVDSQVYQTDDENEKGDSILEDRDGGCPETQKLEDEECKPSPEAYKFRDIAKPDTITLVDDLSVDTEEIPGSPVLEFGNSVAVDVHRSADTADGKVVSSPDMLCPLSQDSDVSRELTMSNDHGLAVPPVGVDGDSEKSNPESTREITKEKTGKVESDLNSRKTAEQVEVARPTREREDMGDGFRGVSKDVTVERKIEESAAMEEADRIGTEERKGGRTEYVVPEKAEAAESGRISKYEQETPTRQRQDECKVSHEAAPQDMDEKPVFRAGRTLGVRGRRRNRIQLPEDESEGVAYKLQKAGMRRRRAASSRSPEKEAAPDSEVPRKNQNQFSLESAVACSSDSQGDGMDVCEETEEAQHDQGPESEPGVIEDVQSCKGVAQNPADVAESSIPFGRKRTSSEHNRKTSSVRDTVKRRKTNAVEAGATEGAAVVETRDTESPHPVIIATSVVLDVNQRAFIKAAGGRVTVNPKEATHIVTDQIRRTQKFLSAISKASYVVTEEWIEECRKAKAFVAEAPYVVADKSSEKKFKCNLKKILAAPNRDSLLAGRSFSITPAVRPKPAEMKTIIECAGGKVLSRRPTKFADNIFIISVADDSKAQASMLKLGFNIYQPELIFSAILSQQFDPEGFVLVDAGSPSTQSRLRGG